MKMWRKARDELVQTNKIQPGFEAQVDGTLFHPESLGLLGMIEDLQGRVTTGATMRGDGIAVLSQRARLQSIVAGLKLNGIEVLETRVAEGLNTGAWSGLSPTLSAAVAGYARAYDIVSSDRGRDALTAAWIRHLHRELMSFSTRDAHHSGTYRGCSLVRPAAAAQDPGRIGSVLPHQIASAIEELVAWWNAQAAEQRLGPVYQVSAFVGRFLVISPFVRGNGRLSLLLAGALLRRSGHDYLNYLSLEHMMVKARSSFLRRLEAARGEALADEVDWEGVFLELAAALERGLSHVARMMTRESRLPADLTPSDSEILAAFTDRESLCNRDLVRLTGINRNTLKPHVRKLVRKGLPKRKGAGRGACYARCL